MSTLSAPREPVELSLSDMLCLEVEVAPWTVDQVSGRCTLLFTGRGLWPSDETETGWRDRTRNVHKNVRKCYRVQQLDLSDADVAAVLALVRVTFPSRQPLKNKLLVFALCPPLAPSSSSSSVAAATKWKSFSSLASHLFSRLPLSFC